MTAAFQIDSFQNDSFQVNGTPTPGPGPGTIPGIPAQFPFSFSQQAIAATRRLRQRRIVPGPVTYPANPVPRTTVAIPPVTYSQELIDALALIRLNRLKPRT